MPKEDHRVDPVPGLDDLEPFMDFGAHVGVGEVAGDEGGADGPAESKPTVPKPLT